MTLRKISGLLCRGPVGRVPLAVPGWAGTPDSSDQHLWPLSIPSNDSEEKLGLAHTRLLLKGARRVFLWELDAAIETVRNEETAAAGAIRVEVVSGQGRRTIKRKGCEHSGNPECQPQPPRD
jgi:hypothetical protein